MSTPRISLVIPAYNEEELLPRLLESIEQARSAYPRGSEAIEVIVADNASTDATARVAAAAGCRVVPVERRCIASARNGGAAIARGEVLAFVDADSVVHPDTFTALDEALSAEVVGGLSGVVPDEWSLGLRVSFYLTMPLLWIQNLDTGLFFLRRADFETLGGYPEDRYFAEDVQLYLAAKKLGRSRRPRQRLVRLRGVRALTSSRKFRKHGDWHLLTSLLKYGLTRPFRPRWGDDFAKRYWYDDR